MTCFLVTLQYMTLGNFLCFGQEFQGLLPLEADLVAEDQGSSVILLQQGAIALTVKPRFAGGRTSGNSSLAFPGSAGLGTRNNSTAALNRVPNEMVSIVFAAVQRQAWHYDVFNSDRESIETNKTLFNAAPGSEWLVLFGSVSVFLLFDYFVLQTWERSKMVNMLSLAFWIVCGFSYNIYFFIRYDTRAATDWCIGYLLEWMLSMDNLFVFHLVFKVYRTPDKQMHRALFFGIVGAVLFRMVFFVALGSLLHVFDWVRFVFGAVLIWSGIEAVRADDDEDQDISNMYSVKLLKWVFGTRLMDKYDEKKTALFTYDADGRICVTMLFFVVMCLELTDILFAVDSVSAKVCQVADQYIAYSSSVLAIFSLRAMFFVIHDLVEVFELLKYGLSFILIFIGVELMLNKIVTVSPPTVCIVISAVFITSICASVAKNRMVANRTREDNPSEKMRSDTGSAGD